MRFYFILFEMLKFYLTKIPGSGTNLLLCSIVQFAHIIQYIFSPLSFTIHVHRVVC